MNRATWYFDVFVLRCSDMALVICGIVFLVMREWFDGIALLLASLAICIVGGSVTCGHLPLADLGKGIPPKPPAGEPSDPDEKAFVGMKLREAVLWSALIIGGLAISLLIHHGRRYYDAVPIGAGIVIGLIYLLWLRARMRTMAQQYTLAMLFEGVMAVASGTYRRLVARYYDETRDSEYSRRMAAAVSDHLYNWCTDDVYDAAWLEAHQTEVVERVRELVSDMEVRRAVTDACRVLEVVQYACGSPTSAPGEHLFRLADDGILISGGYVPTEAAFMAFARDYSATAPELPV